MNRTAQGVADTLTMIAFLALVMMLAQTDTGRLTVEAFGHAFEGAGTAAIYGPSTPYISSNAARAGQKAASPSSAPPLVQQAPAAQSQNALRSIWKGCPSWLCG